MIFTTQSGSTYAINTDSKQIRRLNGKNDPTPRQGKDGEWRHYSQIFPDPISIGSQVMIIWGKEVELLDETKEEIAQTGGSAFPTTTTSHVVSIED